MGFFDSKSSTEEDVDANTQGLEAADYGLNFALANVEAKKGGEVNVAVVATDHGAISAAGELAENALVFAGGARVAENERFGRELDFLENTTETAFSFAGDAVAFIGEVREQAAREQEEVYRRGAAQSAARAKAAETTAKNAQVSADRQTDKAFQFAGEATTLFRDTFAETSAQLQDTYNNSTGAIADFSEAAIAKFTSASASETQQTQEKFLKFSVVAIIAMASAFGLSAWARKG